VPSNIKPIAALKNLQHSAAFFQRFDHGAALKTERKMSYLNIAFDRYASVDTVMHYILVISRICMLVATRKAAENFLVIESSR